MKVGIYPGIKTIQEHSRYEPHFQIQKEQCVAQFLPGKSQISVVLDVSAGIHGQPRKNHLPVCGRSIYYFNNL